MDAFRRRFFLISLLGVLTFISGLIDHAPAVTGISAIVVASGIAIGLGGVPGLRGYQFPAWIVAAVAACLIYPERFLHLGTLDLRDKWLLLLVIQAVMFGMGTRMSLADFGAVARAPRGVVIGVALRFTVMPLAGLGLARLFHLPPEIAAGVVLLGSCSSGLSSNVMAYIAGANLALSIAVTSMTTLVAPLMTPLLMKVLAGSMIEVRFSDMMAEILKIVIVPIGAAMIHDYLKHGSPGGRRTVWRLAAAGAAWLAYLAVFGTDRGPFKVLGFAAGTIVAGALYNWLCSRVPAVDRAMPTVSMAGIVYVTAVTTAAGRDNLLLVGGALLAVSVIHNTLGYVLGYWLSRASGLDRNSARSVAFEVGVQNGGMASGLAAAMGKLSTVGLAPAIFSPWMNVSGPILANHWKRQTGGEPVREPAND
jgi:bile acid:Na+ symporter, BASS family